MNTNSLLNPLHCLKLEVVASLASNSDKLLFYVPMITPSQNEVRTDSKLFDPPGLIENDELIAFRKEIKNAETLPDYGEVKRLFNNVGIEYFMHSRSRGRRSYFSNEGKARADYFDRALSYYVNLNQSSILFFDPDVGSDIGLVKRKRNHPEKYLYESEIELFLDQAQDEDLLLFFQSFTGNYSSRLESLANVLSIHICYFGFDRYQGGLIIGSRCEDTFKEVKKKLLQFKSRLDQSFKAIRPVLIDPTDR